VAWVICSVLIFSLGLEMTLCLMTSLEEDSLDSEGNSEKFYSLNELVLLEIDEAEAKHSPQVSGVELHVVSTADVVDADLLSC
jgi:hypothetical protein